ncbi:Peptidyl-tRNA hydrolase [Candidatus Arsenophonus lipoptenae]|uniref:Peptidyl-tRNA hydrolase n=1 Tax=Candidatus Arsenophonus lipoptenae TaxID=634113 RepID=A0A109Q7J8_9GAMM|nr:aminoacyl-tRNA hydrolase [Candidatus Arsenophonus lipoptenae]AMA65084.1 Peptidyl-tRNA hydrolase [Candidatus Arsenophonus lipoptenae]
MDSKIKLIVGLANPGHNYEFSRHNVGSWYVKLLAKQYNQFLKEEKIFFGYTTTIFLADEYVRLLIPKTYINFSGTSILALINFYDIKPTEILIAHDELDLIPGIAKIKFGGSNNGHNGLKDIQAKLNGNSNFYRLRIGIGHPGDKKKVINFVLNKPSVHEQKLIYNSIHEAINCTPILINKGIKKAINRLHAFKGFN